MTNAENGQGRNRSSTVPSDDFTSGFGFLILSSLGVFLATGSGKILFRLLKLTVESTGLETER